MTTQGAVVPTAGFGASQMSDYIMTNMFYTKILDSMKDGVKLSPSCIFKLLLLMSVNEAKPYFPSAVKHLYELVKTIPSYVTLSWVWFALRNLRKPKLVERVPITDRNIYKSIDLNVDQIFISMFYNYLVG